MTGRPHDNQPPRPQPFLQYVRRWVLSLRESKDQPGQFKMSVSVEPSVFTSCFAAFVLHQCNGLKDIPQTEKDQWASYIQGLQDPATGFFLDPEFQRRRDQWLTSSHDLEYLTWQLSTFCISALSVLGSWPQHRMRGILDLRTPEGLTGWLAKQNWRDPWNVGNRAMFLMILLITDYEISGDDNSLQTVHRALDWHDEYQDRATGYWGEGRRAKYFDGLFGAFHQYLIYYYLDRDLPGKETIIDATLRLQMADGTFSPFGGGGGCEEMDGIVTLTTLALRTDYRREDIVAALRRAHSALLRFRNPDGGFCWARRRFMGPIAWVKSALSLFSHFDLYRWYLENRYRLAGQRSQLKERLPFGWVNSPIPNQESDLFSTFTRLDALANIYTVLPELTPDGNQIQFLPAPGLGNFTALSTSGLRRKDGK